MIVALAIALLLGGLIQWSGTERDITVRHVARAKARMAAESVDQYGAAQIKARLDKLIYFADDEFRPKETGGDVKVSTLVHELLESGATGIGQSLKEAKGNGSSNPNSSGNGSESPAPNDSFFRYEITPDNLVIGRFTPARWERAEGSNPLYVGDPLIDQLVRVREVRMASSAKAVNRLRGDTIMAYCESYLQVRDAPVWGNVLFYNMDLELAPYASMEIYGPVHTNGNIYVQSDNTLRFYDPVTAAGNLYRGRTLNGWTAGNGTVTFKKSGTTSEFVSLKQKDVWIDSHSPDWAAQASTLWAGSVRTHDHGINPATPAGIPSYTPDDPATSANEWSNPAHVLIEPAVQNNDSNYPGDAIEVQKFAAKACLVFEVSSTGAVALYKYEADTSGRYIRDEGLGAKAYTRRQLTIPTGLVVGDSATDKFYDKRRGQWVKSLDLDVGKLKTLIETSGQAASFKKGSVTFDPATEWNGIVYVAHAHTARGGVRLVNGRYIPNRPTSANGNAAGFTVATEAPLYVQGSYNADGTIASDGNLIRQPDSSSEPPAGLAADAVTILSPGWSDAKSDKDLSQRKAQQTEVAAALLTGIVPTNKNGNGIYGGGVENLPRLLEHWAGVKLGYRGSMAVLYESQRATEAWGSSNVYEPPTRVWGFNAQFASGVLPPGAPNSRTYRRIGFRDLSPAEYQAALDAINDD
jgi:hypothetical protein